MKTAMQELRDILENCKMVDINDEQKSIFSSIIYQIDIIFLEKEKEQIMNDYRHGHIDGFTSANHLGTEFENEEDYYKQTYNQNK